MSENRDLPAPAVPASLPGWRRVCRQLLHLPVSVAASTREYCGTAGAAGYRPVSEASAYRRTAPRSGNPAMIASYLDFQQGRRQQRESFVTQLTDGRVHNDRGYVVSRDGVLLHDVSRHYGMGDPAAHRLMRKEWWGGSRHRLRGRAVVLTSDGADLYYHWLLDLLPRLGVLAGAGHRLSDFDWFVVPRNRVRSGDAILEALGIPPAKVVEVSRFASIQADELTVPSYASEVLQPSHAAVDFLRGTVAAQMGARPASGSSLAAGERLYVRRTGRRRLGNQAAAEAVLQRHGFQVVQSEKLSMAEQMRLFARARIVVGVHGAGLANSVFCPPGSVLVELTVPRYPFFCFWDLASVAGLGLYSVFGDGAYDPAQPQNPKADLTIDPDRLEACLQLADSSLATASHPPGGLPG